MFEVKKYENKTRLFLLLISTFLGIVLFVSYNILSCASIEKNQLTNENAPAGMTLIPGGYVFLGASEDDKEALPGEKPLRKVYVKTFYIDKYEITNEEYNKCVKAGA